MGKTERKDAMGRALARLDAALDAQPKALARVLRKGLTRGVDHRKLWWAEQQLGVPLPVEMRVLYTWHDGQRTLDGLFDCALRTAAEAVLPYGCEQARGAWLRLADVVRCGVPGMEYWDQTLRHERFGKPGEPPGYDAIEFVPAGNDARPTTFIPLATLYDAECETDEGPMHPSDGAFVIAVDTTFGTVVLYEEGHEDLEQIVEVAPSLPAWIDMIAAGLAAGTLLLPTIEPEVKGRQQVDSAALLLHELEERRSIELAPDADRSALTREVGTLLRRKPRERAIGDVVAWLENDERFEEVFADSEVLAVLIAEYVG